MGCRIRHWEANRVYSAVIRTVDRQFLLKPDHDPRHPLLAAGCPPEALDPSNDLTPIPSVLNIIGACAARAQSLYPVAIHALETNVNHKQLEFSGNDSQVHNLSPFMRTFNSAVAVQLNKKWQRDGHLWAARMRTTPCLDDESAEQQQLYILTNPVKDGLIETVSESPLFTTYRALAYGEPLEFWRIDWNAYYLAGGARKKRHRPKDYLEWLTLELAPLPHQADWPEHRRQTWTRQQVRKIEAETREQLRGEGRRVFGAKRLFRIDPRDRPKDPKHGGLQPLCHAADPALRKAYAEAWRELLAAHREASLDYRAGMHDRVFPEGTFRPPIVTLCTVLRQ